MQSIDGGGVLQALDVKCVTCLCGDILMSVNDLNVKTKIVDQLLLNEKGLQGEVRRFFVESLKLDAASLELSEFKVRVRV